MRQVLLQNASVILLQNATIVYLLQNVLGFLLQNAAVLLQNAILVQPHIIKIGFPFSLKIRQVNFSKNIFRVS